MAFPGKVSLHVSSNTSMTTMKPIVFKMVETGLISKSVWKTWYTVYIYVKQMWSPCWCLLHKISYHSFRIAWNVDQPLNGKALPNDLDNMWICGWRPVIYELGFSHNTILKVAVQLPSPPPGHSQNLFHSHGEKSGEKAWNHCYVTGWKWWTWLVRNVDSVCTNWIHHFWPLT